MKWTCAPQVTTEGMLDNGRRDREGNQDDDGTGMRAAKQDGVNAGNSCRYPRNK